MATQKRPLLDNDEASSSSKRHKDLLPDDESRPLTPPCDSIEIVINVPSKYKARRNDPRPQNPDTPLHLDKQEREKWIKAYRRMCISEASMDTDIVVKTDNSSENNTPSSSWTLGGCADGSPDYPESLVSIDTDLDDTSSCSFHSLSYGIKPQAESLPEKEEVAFRWNEAIYATVFAVSPDNSTRKRIGFCVARLIRRQKIRATFFADMDKMDRPTSSLARELFDNVGRLKREFMYHPIKKGSGIWGSELDHGDIFFIQKIVIAEEYRGSGLGTKVMVDMLEKAREKTNDFFALICPTVNVHEVHDSWKMCTENEKKLHEFQYLFIIFNFCRDLGFRRIGSSNWFGLASSDHPSYDLDKVDDFDRGLPCHYRLHPISTLMGALVRREDSFCCLMIQDSLRYMPPNHPFWGTRDRFWNNLLHVAAVNFKPMSIKWLARFTPHLLYMRNITGETPLEALNSELEKLRSKSRFDEGNHQTSARFMGYSESAIQCIVFLQNKSFHRVSTDDMLRLKYGCTCKQCIQGVCSPRMHMALLFEAGMSYYKLYVSVHYDENEFFKFNESTLAFFTPRSINAFKTHRHARTYLVTLWAHVINCLQDNRLPTPQGIEKVLENMAVEQSGLKGRVDPYVLLDCIIFTLFFKALHHDTLVGNGRHRKQFDKDIKSLPECRNDHEYDFVWSFCE